MAAYNNKVERNVQKINTWNGEDVYDILDAVDVIEANAKANIFEVMTIDDLRRTESPWDAFKNVVLAVDTQGNVLLSDLTVMSVDEMDKKAARINMGLASFDQMLDALRADEIELRSNISLARDKMTKSGRSRSAAVDRYEAVLAKNREYQVMLKNAMKTVEDKYAPTTSSEATEAPVIKKTTKKTE